MVCRIITRISRVITNTISSMFVLAVVTVFLSFQAVPALAQSENEFVTLAGQWRFLMSNAGADANQQTLPELKFTDTILLPGTTDENRKGTRNEAREKDRLTRLYPYNGAAWYQRDINVPPAWAGKHIVLFLERTKNSWLWVDSNDLGRQNSLVAPHSYSIGPLSPGRHQLTLRIDNSKYPPIADSHQISDQTQTNWNGIIGKIGLLITDPVYIEDVQVYPDLTANKIRVRIEIGNTSSSLAKGTLTLKVAAEKDANAQGQPLSIPFETSGQSTIAEADYALGKTVQYWSEFSPVLYKLSVSLRASLVDSELCDHREISFGLRDFSGSGTQFKINGKATFLRGKHDACVFPLTGYPPMTVDGWLDVFKIAKSYGINHYRFHSWCPPKAAFEAADRLGIYLQPELPNWAAFGNPEHDDFCRAEGERILREFGNHPSFVMLALGNELAGKQELMAPFIKQFRSLNPRHLYAQGSNNWFGDPDPGDDFWVSWHIQWQKRIRGSYASVDTPLGHVQTGPASTLKDYTREIQGVKVPFIAHEIGEYQFAPDFREIAKYTGVVRACNLETFRDRLERKGMLDQAHDFFRAVGPLSVLCYREDIEAALRTRGFGGFQLLDLQDFPGQGTALVGILNAFMQSKGFIKPAKWREFCCETVPLLRMSKYTWTNSETFTAKAEVAHYGPSDLKDAVVVWTLYDCKGKKLTSGRLPVKNIPQGSVTSLGDINIPLKDYATPTKLTLQLALDGTAFTNSYHIWVYPDKAYTAPGSVIISRALDDATREVLASGKNVLLLPQLTELKNSVQGAFAPDFWNYGMFEKLAGERNKLVAPGTLGMLCDPNHPALRNFPSEFHSNWQWFNLLQNSRSIILDSMPTGYRPLIQIIDNYERAHKLAAAFEVKVGPGKLLVCSIDLLGQQDKPEARQLLHSLLKYMNSEQFAPVVTMDAAVVERIVFSNSVEMDYKGK